jgi:hypothetical protein
MTNNLKNAKDENEQVTGKLLEKVAWGLVLIWTGYAMLRSIDWGIVLLGLGAIALSAQAARKYFAVKVDRFGLILGGFLAAMGAIDLLQIRLSGSELFPIISIMLGGLFLLSALLSRRDSPKA